MRANPASVHTSTAWVSQFAKQLRQTSMLNHYRPWHGHDSAIQKGPNSGLADAQMSKGGTP